ncbi:MAG: TetR/AcrR family transcriptional regulator [Devosia sp.]
MTDIDLAPARPAFAKPPTKRTAILDATKRAIVRDGFAALSIDSIATEAGVSRQTIYNQLGDRDQLLIAVIEDVTARSSASLMAVLATFPDKPDDIQSALVDFAVRLMGRCMCDIDGRALTALLKREAQNHPALFAAWAEYGPGQDWPLIAGRFAKLAQDGYLDLPDASTASRHFFALINSDLADDGTCVRPSEEALRKAAATGVATFLRAFGSRQA